MLVYENLASKNVKLQLPVFFCFDAAFADLSVIHPPQSVPIIIRIGTETALSWRNNFLFSTI